MEKDEWGKFSTIKRADWKSTPSKVHAAPINSKSEILEPTRRRYLARGREDGDRSQSCIAGIRVGVCTSLEGVRKSLALCASKVTSTSANGKEIVEK